jgi:hypothetical protein
MGSRDSQRRHERQTHANRKRAISTGGRAETELL